MTVWETHQTVTEKKTTQVPCCKANRFGEKAVEWLVEQSHSSYNRYSKFVELIQANMLFSVGSWRLCLWFVLVSQHRSCSKNCISANIFSILSLSVVVSEIAFICTGLWYGLIHTDAWHLCSSCSAYVLI